MGRMADSNASSSSEALAEALAEALGGPAPGAAAVDLPRGRSSTSGSWVDEWAEDWTDFGTSEGGRPEAVRVDCDTLPSILVRRERGALAYRAKHTRPTTHQVLDRTTLADMK